MSEVLDLPVELASVPFEPVGKTVGGSPQKSTVHCVTVASSLNGYCLPTNTPMHPRNFAGSVRHRCGRKHLTGQARPASR